MRFNSFVFILFGMSMIGFSIGYIFGYYLQMVTDNHYLVYFSAPLLGFGSGCVIYGAIFRRKNIN